MHVGISLVSALRKQSAFKDTAEREPFFGSRLTVFKHYGSFGSRGYWSRRGVFVACPRRDRPIVYCARPFRQRRSDTRLRPVPLQPRRGPRHRWQQVPSVDTAGPRSYRIVITPNNANQRRSARVTHDGRGSSQSAFPCAGHTSARWQGTKAEWLLQNGSILILTGSFPQLDIGAGHFIFLVDTTR